ncbi:MAG: tRNA (N6-isopentenyl adenosine(37)-C2)-methylthiotransferase MiaB, partial [Actinomycetia bacterium]|nr:tRNA (N6-isopentenyl adenosine(37)-C2)-methylthiotransferase MiaB [Actinomycetes bacterium]
MNKHDSEKIAGILVEAGMEAVDEVSDADVVIFMTCCVREKADERLYGQVASLKTYKTNLHSLPLIAVGGCIGQRDGQELIEKLPHIDVVFGTHNIAHLPELLEQTVKTTL